jgi:hypothetical protein
MSAPPEVVFNTAIDPARLSAWLPTPLRQEGDRGPEVTADALQARWTTGARPGWSAQLQVQPIAAGGARVRLELEAEPAHRRLTEIADESLASLAREVADNLTAG